MTITRNPNSYPDAVAEGLVATPPYPVSGETVAIQGTIRNAGGASLKNVPVTLRMRPPGGSWRDVYAQTIGVLNQNASTTVRYTLDTTGTSGDYDFALFADPDNVIVESVETNNVATFTLHVAASRGIEARMSTDRPAYVLGATASITVSLVSSDAAKDYVVSTRIEDSTGTLTTTLEDRALSAFGAASTTYTLSWPVASVVPGAFRVHVVVSKIDATSSGGGAASTLTQVAEALSPFTVTGTTLLQAKVKTDRLTYAVGSAVNVSAEATNLGTLTASGLTTRLTVETEPDGAVIATRSVSLPPVPAGGKAPLSWAWDSTGTPSGTYRAAISVADGSGSPLAQARSLTFTLVGGPIHSTLSGTMSVLPVKVEPPGAVTVHYSARTGSGTGVLSSVSFTVSAVDPVTGNVAASATKVFDVGPNGLATDEILVTNDWTLAPYVLVLTAEGVEGATPYTHQLASTALIVTDLTPPVVTLLSPSAAVSCELVSVKARAVDALSGVRRVFYRLDGATQELPLSITAINLPSDDTYSARWTPAAQSGSHSIAVYAEDLYGNVSDPVTVVTTFDPNPLELLVDGIVDGACYPGSVAATAATTAALGVNSTFTIDGVSYVSGAVIDEEGEHNLVVYADDACGRSRVRSQRFVIDKTPPSTTVTGVVEGGVHPPGTTLTWTAQDAHLLTASATLNGTPIPRKLTLGTPGSFVLVIDAADCAGNPVQTTMHFQVAP